jgi:hypothetical protein
MKESQYRLYSNYCRGTSRSWNSLEGLPSMYYPGPMLLNFRVWMRTVVSNMVTLLFFVFFWFKWVPDRGPEQRESNLTVLCVMIIIILISCIIIYYYQIMKLLIMENHPSWNWKRSSTLLFTKHRYLEMVKVNNVAKCFWRHE